MHEQFRNFARRDRAIVRDPRDRLPRAQRAGEQSPERDATLVIVVRQRGDEQLRRLSRFDLRRGQVSQNRIEERLEPPPLPAPVCDRGGRKGGGQCRSPANRVGVDNRKLGLLVGRAEVNEQVEGRVRDVVQTRVRAIHFVDDDDCFVSQFERFAENETRLRHRPIHRVHEQQHAVHHVQHALHLAAEIGVTRRVHDVDLDAAKSDCRVLRQNRNAALALQVVRVEHALDDGLVVAKDMRLLEHRVHERGLAVIHVRDDSDVS